jgi:hypothetical protein
MKDVVKDNIKYKYAECNVMGSNAPLPPSNSEKSYEKTEVKR